MFRGTGKPFGGPSVPALYAVGENDEAFLIHPHGYNKGQWIVNIKWEINDTFRESIKKDFVLTEQ